MKANSPAIQPVKTLRALYRLPRNARTSAAAILEVANDGLNRLQQQRGEHADEWAKKVKKAAARPQSVRRLVRHLEDAKRAFSATRRRLPLLDMSTAEQLGRAIDAADAAVDRHIASLQVATAVGRKNGAPKTGDRPEIEEVYALGAAATNAIAKLERVEFSDALRVVSQFLQTRLATVKHAAKKDGYDFERSLRAWMRERNVITKKS